MATMVNIYESYGDKSARERAELIYSNYSSFQGIIEDCKMRLIYEIKAEKERKRSNHKDELGVRIQNLGNYINPTADEAVLDVMLEEAINGLNSTENALSDPALVQEFKQREYVIVMMADEYASLKRHLHALSVKEQEIIIPLLKHRIGRRDKRGRSVGQSPCKHIWGNKLVCTCGHAMNRRIAHKAKDGDFSYIYQCYGQLRTGTPESRRKKGLEVDGICDNSSFMEWKLEVQADFIFKKLLSNKEVIYREAMSMLSDVAEVKAPERNDKKKLERNMKQLDKLHKQMANLVDMCADGDISREVFRSKKKKLEDQISNIE